MIKKIYILKDKKIGYKDETLHTAISEGIAIRGFYNALYGKNNDYWRYAEDFELCEIGAIDNEIGQLIPGNITITVKEGSDAKKEIEQHENNEKK